MHYLGAGWSCSARARASSFRRVPFGNDLLVLGAFEGVQLVSPRQFLAWLDASGKAKSVADTEMAETPNDDPVRRLKTGSRQARQRKGRFVD